MPKCKNCEHCINIGRADAKYSGNRHVSGRKYYYCKHPNRPAKKDFISCGDCTYASPIVIKTSPCWCPLKGER